MTDLERARQAAASYWADSPCDTHAHRAILSGEWDEQAYTQAALAAIQSERAAVVRWLRDLALADTGARSITEGSLVRSLFWSLTHPRQFREAVARFKALTSAATAIEKGEHHAS